MRILFCDDNPEILDQLQKYVTEFFKGMGKLLPEMATYTSGDDLLQKERYADIAWMLKCQAAAEFMLALA